MHLVASGLSGEVIALSALPLMIIASQMAQAPQVFYHLGVLVGISRKSSTCWLQHAVPFDRSDVKSAQQQPGPSGLAHPESPDGP